MRPPTHAPDALSANARRGLAIGALALHVAGVWALQQLDPVRRAVGEVAPIVVDWIAAPPPPTPSPPPRRPPKAVPKPQPKPAIVSEAAPATVFVAPAPPPHPAEPALPAPEPVALAPAPPPPPAPPPAPRTVAITAVEYLTPPALNYPAASRRLQEQGQVQVRVLVDAKGLPQQVAVIRSSGHARLDDAALATVRQTRFKPYTENGTPLPFWVVIPFVFEIET